MNKKKVRNSWIILNQVNTPQPNNNQQTNLAINTEYTESFFIFIFIFISLPYFFSSILLHFFPVIFIFDNKYESWILITSPDFTFFHLLEWRGIGRNSAARFLRHSARRRYWCGTVQYGMVWYSMVRYGVLQCSVVEYSIMWCDMVWYGAV